MGVFGIGTNVKRIDSGIIRGTMYSIACMAWYAPGRPPRPLLFKFEGDIDHVASLSATLRNYYNMP